LFPLFATGVIETGGKFATGVVLVAIWQRRQQNKRNWWQNLPPVHLVLDLQISPRIFEKIQNVPNFIFRGLGEGDS
jgi:hypothetical protein